MGKIGESFIFVGRVKAKAETEKGGKDGKEAKPVIVLKLAEKDGKEFDWTSFDTGAWDEAKRGDCVKVRANLSENPNGKWPFKNLEAYLGKADESEIGFSVRPDAQGNLSQPQSAPGQPSPAGRPNGKSPEQFVVERISIERQGAVEATIQLLESGFTIEQLETDLPRILGIASKIEAHFARSGASAASQQPQMSAPKAVISPQKNGAAPQGQPVASTVKAEGDTEIDASKFKNVGDLLAAANKRWKKSRDNCLEFFDVKNPPDILNSYTLPQAWEAMKAVWDGPEPRD